MGRIPPRGKPRWGPRGRNVMVTKIIPKGDNADKLVDTAGKKKRISFLGDEREGAVDLLCRCVWLGVPETGPVRHSLRAASEYDQ